jgi:RNA polymerase sigma-70 factor, ECF subfamily
MTDTEHIRVALRAQAGDRDSIEALLRELQPPLRSYIAGLVGLTSVDDVLQEALFQIWRDLRWLREPELLRHWSYRIASRCSFKWLKKNRRFLQADNDAFSVEAIPAPSRNDLQLFTTTDEFLEILSPASRAVLVLHYLHEHSLEEVAAILEISAGTAKSRLAYGLSRLREFINQKGVKQ